MQTARRAQMSSRIRFAARAAACALATSVLTVSASTAAPPGRNAATPGRQTTCVVPKVSGKTLGKAKTALTRVHCATGRIKHKYSQRVAKGKVISQGKKPGRTLAAGSKVSLTVSKGRQPIIKLPPGVGES